MKLVDPEKFNFLGPQGQETAFLCYRPLFSTAFVCDVCRFDLVCKNQDTINARCEQAGARFNLLQLQSLHIFM